MAGSKRQRVAVLGGGIGALAAVHRLTLQPNWQDRFDITVYEQGWRLGGKGASGRNTRRHDRSEEHGLHIWAGFYENAFRMMNEIYREYVPAPNSPIRSVRDAFIKENHLCLAEFHRGEWLDWHMYYEPNDEWPGEGETKRWTPLQCLIRLLHRLCALHGQLPPDLRAILPAASLDLPDDVASAIPPADPRPATAGDMLLHGAHAIAQAAHRLAHDVTSVAVSIGWCLRLFRYDVMARIDDILDGSDTDTRRLVIALDLLRCIAAAMVFDGILVHGFAAVEDYDLIELLRRHHPLKATINSALVVAAYDYTFAYEGGDRAKPRLSAASALEAFFRLVFSYKGAVFFKMAAGAGEVVFAPIYDVLKKKGVKFEFFHRVDELIPKDGNIHEIRLSVQSRPIAPTYEPLFDVKGLPCWPSRPRYDLLVNGKELQRRKLDLEDDGQNYALDRKTLTYKGEENGFDAVILGIPPGAQRRICARLAQQSPAWRHMLEKIATVSTQSLQLWSDWRMPSFGGAFVHPYPPPDAVGPTSTCFEPPFDTWADMSHVLNHERWGANGPHNLAYFCGVMSDPPRRATDSVRSNAVAWLNRHAGGLWPRAADAEGFHWALLHAASGKRGEKRIDDQFWRANISGSHRYVLSLPGTLKYRLPPSPVDFANLYLAGDWVRVAAINAGCMEIAVMAGCGAAAALAGTADGVV